MTSHIASSDPSELLIVAAGGTILKQQEGAVMKWSVSPETLLEEAAPSLKYRLRTGYSGLASDFCMSDVVTIAKIIEAEPDLPVLITVGTDVLEEVSFGLDVLLGGRRKVVITGSMRPYGREGYEGIRHLADSIATLQDDSVPNGVFVVFNEQIFLGRTLRKMHSTRADAFAADPGPLGGIVSGRPKLHAVPITTEGADLSAKGLETIDDIRVPIVWSHMNSGFDAVSLGDCSGVVVAAMGAGSMPTRMKDFLAEHVTPRIPVVISSRCAFGPSHAELMYTGSVKKYTDLNFVVKAFEDYTPLQARIKLQIDIALGREGSYFVPVQGGT